MIDDTCAIPTDLVFYHTIEISPGVVTPGWPAVQPIVDLVRQSMKSLPIQGRRVLDIGCRDGAMAFEAERLGASEVIAIDFDLPRQTTSFLKEALSSNVRFEEMNLFDLRPETFGSFDLIIFPGVVYHLRYPMTALRLMRDLVREGGHLLVETATFSDANALPLMFCPTGDNSPYEPTSCTFFNKMGFTKSVESFGFTVASDQSLLNLPPYAGEMARDVPIDRTVFTCIRETQPQNESILKYWDSDRDPHAGLKKFY